ncbi:unnamed protein product [Echinostoma caproni]|uniref:Uncharacterized protein n=1 Tax=Echinostoma caproni TaxID=27848 RepID=A0A183ANP0_9TREM|nr:unnamed protein product [Echinostoma caproni]
MSTDFRKQVSRWRLINRAITSEIDFSSFLYDVKFSLKEDSRRDSGSSLENISGMTRNGNIRFSKQTPYSLFILRLLLSSTLLYRFKSPIRTEEARLWKVTVESTRYGAVVRARKIKSHATTVLGQRNHSLGIGDMESSRVVISELLLEHIAESSDSRPTSSPWNEEVDTTQSDYYDFTWKEPPGEDELKREPEESGGQPMIRVQLLRLLPHNISQLKRGQPFPMLTLMAPQLVPQPGAMHVFVEFEIFYGV